MPTPTIEFFIDGGWVDFTRLDNDTHVLANDSQGITIVRGRDEGQGEIPPMSVKFEYLDNNCVLDPDNPYSPYYRKIDLGTPLRVKEAMGSVRGVFELKKMTLNNEERSVIKWTIEGVDILDRLTSGQQPFDSTAVRALSDSSNDSTRIFYAPLEEEEGATKVYTHGGVGLVQVFGEIEFGGDTDSQSSARLISLGEFGTVVATMPSYTSTEHKVCMLLKFPTAGLANASVPIRLQVSGNVDTIDLVYSTGNSMRLNAYRGSILVDQTDNTSWNDYIADNQEFFISIELSQNGANLDTAVLIIREDGTGGVPTEQLTAVTVTSVNKIIVNYASDLNGSSVGQMILGNDTNAFNNYINGNDYARGTTGFLREPAAVRVERMFEQIDVPITIVGNEGDSPLMGSEPVGKFGEMLTEAVALDMGILASDREALGVQYRTRVSLYNQPAAVELSYQSSHLVRGLTPDRNDTGVANDVTVNRANGGASARYVIPDNDPWHWTTQAPPEGARQRTGVSPSLNALEDEQLNELAAWIAHVASWREKRIPVVPVNLSRPSIDADTRAALLAMDLGDVFYIDATGAPRYLPYNEVRLMVQGYEEFMNQTIHTLAFNTTSADIYEVNVVTFGPTATLANVIDDNDTSLKISPGDGPSASTTDEPYHINVDGDPMTVTAITNDTPTFIAAGAVSYADNAAVTPALPAGMTVDVGQAMIAVVFRRQTGAGVIGATPTGWTEIFRSPDNDWVVAGRYYRTGDAAVQWTVSGGAAGGTVGGVVLGYSGLSIVADKNARGGYPLGYTRSVNGSAANIAYPGYASRRTNSLVFIIGKKDDDWTSVAQVTTERVDSSSTAGDDIGIVINAAVSASPALTSAGSFTVTGGASAVSEGIVFGLRCLQTATVTRSIAGVAVAHAVGDGISTWRPGVNGL